MINNFPVFITVTTALKESTDLDLNTVDFTKLLPKYSKFRSKVRKFVAKFKVHIENHKPVS